MEYILDEYFNNQNYTIINGLFRCNFVLPRTVRINNAEFYNASAIEINPKRSIVTLHFKETGPINVPTEFLAFEVKIQWNNKNKIVQIYT